MADPRQVGPQMRRANLSPLMQALVKRSQGEVPNFCPFGCAAEDLDDNGYCGHLIGFYKKGGTFEPRVKNKHGRIITSGATPQPMKRGYKLVKITDTARVYSPQPVKDLTVRKHEADRVMAEIAAEEARLVAQAEAIKNPVLEGDWGDSPYAERVAAAATKTDAKT